MNSNQTTDHANTGGADGTGKGGFKPKPHKTSFPGSNGPSGAKVSGADKADRNKKS